jgi:SAM-dependent methyltransferase
VTGRSGLESLLEGLGGLDIYLIDQLMKGRLTPGARILDAGCGGGRNSELFLRFGYEVFAVDQAARATRQTLGLAREVGAQRPDGWISRQDVDALGFRSGSFDVVISSALLHFARDREHFGAMVEEMWRVLAPGGLFFARLASTIGIEAEVEALGEGRFRLPNGVEWLLVDRGSLLEWSERLGGRLIEPIKTTVVDDQRAMTTWCLVKPA